MFFIGTIRQTNSRCCERKEFGRYADGGWCDGGWGGFAGLDGM